ncbi:hypothetical protein DsansV1_C22g0173181 [Dioscorea sansibarensis]
MRPSPSPVHSGDDNVVGILSFEVAAAMSRAVHLHRSLSDAMISRLRAHTLSSPSIRTLVSSDEHHLLSLSVAEKLDALNRIAAVTARLGRRCRLPTLSGFEHIYSDLISGRLHPSRLAFLSKDIDAAFRKMERFVSSTAKLYTELSDSSHQVLDQMPQWQLRNASLWNQTFDKVVLLLARAVCTIHARIQVVFESHQLYHCPPCSTSRKTVSFPGPCASSPGRFLMECLSLSSSSCPSLNDVFDEENFERESNVGREEKFGKNESLWFGPKSSLTMLAPSSTVGGSALALHYSNVIIIIEKLMQYPHLVGEEARDDLYLMLPSSLRIALRKSLKSYVKNLAIYDAPLAHDWKEKMKSILSWLAPMAHNMVQWQMDRNFEQQQIVLRSNVLLLETLYFADREKTEAAICELLVGLNYMCRYEQQKNALFDCTSSLDFDNFIGWKGQC